MKIHTEINITALAEFFKIFSDVTRLKILDSLLNGNKCVSELADDINMTPSCISHQLKNLRALNLVKSEKSGQNVMYSISDEHIRIILEYGIEHIKEGNEL